MAKTADDLLSRPQGYHDFNELRDRARLQEAAQPARGSPALALARAPAVRAEVGLGDENMRRRPKSGLPSGRGGRTFSALALLEPQWVYSHDFFFKWAQPHLASGPA
eukprot:s1012_g13.t1